jgi:hypothetical protein
VSGKERLPPSGEDDWVQQRGGQRVKLDSVSVTVEGASARSALLTRLEIKSKCDKPISGTTIEYNIGDSVAPRHFEVDLDQPRPIARPKDGNDDAGQRISAVSFPFKVSENDPEVFEIYATTNRYSCEWSAELYWVVEGRKGVTPITDKEGKPFRVSARQPGPTYILAADGTLIPQ